MSLLQVDDLSVEYGAGAVRAVDGVSFSLGDAESIGLVGESGCGKTTTAKALLRLLPESARVTRGTAMFDGEDLLTIPARQLRRLRWEQIALVPQTSMNSLDPVLRVGDQIAEAVRAHVRLPADELTERMQEASRLVGLDPRRLRDYPHQFSGGMRQRLVLAMALVLRPRLLVADEPTTALDVITQHRIIEKIIEIQQRLGLSVIYISHDIGVIWRTCEQVAVMYAGRIVELGATRDVLTEPTHPYTIGLMNAFPSVRSTQKIISIPGYPPRLGAGHTGCDFASRCPFVRDRCRQETPPLIRLANGRQTACHFPEEVEAMRSAGAYESTWQKAVATP